jgi:putative nucleotidyltransferase with HDIG domain
MTGQEAGGVSSDGAATGAINVSSLLPLRLVSEALRQAAFAFLCGPLMAGLLPLVEKAFDVQTDLSLLELSDMSHPLLRQLAQRAPGTYNHSISVAALAETAAESIGAHGLLVRVGAIFHDIGKMFKPNYFVENQVPGANRHDTLQPGMSTLIIIAHVKDGADLARRHRLPKRVIDFIEQHHGTTLVEYFYKQAHKKSEESEEKDEVSESSFRYPGPKPQTREAAVLMIADAAESASRALVEPTASRLQNLVDQISMKKLLDGQFDECGLTLLELDTIKRSLVKSLAAIYHGRIKYPDQTAANAS